MMIVDTVQLIINEHVNVYLPPGLHMLYEYIYIIEGATRICHPPCHGSSHHSSSTMLKSNMVSYRSVSTVTGTAVIREPEPKIVDYGSGSPK